MNEEKNTTEQKPMHTNAQRSPVANSRYAPRPRIQGNSDLKPLKPYQDKQDRAVMEKIKPTDKRAINKLFPSVQRREPEFYDLRNAPKDKLLVFAFGGLEEVGINMMGFMYNNDIVIIDMGLGFPDEDLLGVDYIIPDVECLRGLEKKHKRCFYNTWTLGPYWCNPTPIRPIRKSSNLWIKAYNWNDKKKTRRI